MRNIVGAVALFALLLPGFVRGSDKKNSEPFYRRYLVAGNALDDKILDQEKRVDANPKSADLHNDFGNLLAARRFPKEAREQYELAMKLDAHHFLAPYNLGLLYETLGETGRAISAYEKSVDRNRGFPPSRFRLGRLYEKRGWEGRAIEQYARALQIDPSMRDPPQPMIVDTRLLDRVSIQNYPRDFAGVDGVEAPYADRDRLRGAARPVISPGCLHRSRSKGRDGSAAGPSPVRVSLPRPPRRPPPTPSARRRRPCADAGFDVRPPARTAPCRRPTRPAAGLRVGGFRPAHRRRPRADAGGWKD
jgi:hypothetical protein